MDKLITVKEAAELLSINEKTLYRLISQRQIPFIRRKGLGYRLRESDLIRWLQEGYEPPSGWKNVLS